MNAERERQLDYAIDRALAGYAGEPRPGLENRTLARLRAKEVRSRAFGWRWLLSGTVAACVLVAAFVGIDLYRKHQQQHVASMQQSPLAKQQTAYNNLPSAARVEVRTPASAPKAAKRHYVAAATLETAFPSLAEQLPAQFPTPAPLSHQELLLAQLAQRTDPKLLGTLAHSSQSESIEPLKIEPLRITPLNSGSDSQASPQPDSQSSNQAGPQQLNMR